MIKISYILKVFLVFFIYSVVGYILEVIVTSLPAKKLNLNRGFMIGPYIPIYGTGAIAMSFLLAKYQDDLLVLFIMSTIICSVIEYLTSYIMEKIYKLRWWDYSHKKFNINGRICLTSSIFFGLGGVLIMKFINPLITKLFTITPNLVLIIIAVIAFLIFITDLIISIIVTFKIEVNINNYINQDATLAIRKEITEKLEKYKFQVSRMLDAYPNIKSLDDMDLDFVKEIIDNAKIKAEKLKKEIKKLKEEYSDKEIRQQKIEEFKAELKEKFDIYNK